MVVRNDSPKLVLQFRMAAQMAKLYVLETGFFNEEKYSSRYCYCYDCAEAIEPTKSAQKITCWKCERECFSGCAHEQNWNQAYGEDSGKTKVKKMLCCQCKGPYRYHLPPELRVDESEEDRIEREKKEEADEAEYYGRQDDFM